MSKCATARKEGRQRVALTDPIATPLPGDEIPVSHRRNLVRTLLAELPPAQAEALALYVVVGYCLEEVACATSTPLNTVRSRLRLARRALKERIESDPMLIEELDVEHDDRSCRNLLSFWAAPVHDRPRDWHAARSIPMLDFPGDWRF